MRVLSIEVHTMCLTLMTKQAGVGGEFELPAVSMFALVGLQVGVQIFAALISRAGPAMERNQLTRSHIFAWLAYAHTGFRLQKDT